MEAPQGPEAAADFSLLDQTKLSILTTATARRPAQARGNKKMSIKGTAFPPSFFQNRKFSRRSVADTIYLSNISLNRTDQSKIKKNKNYKKQKQQHEA